MELNRTGKLAITVIGAMGLALTLAGCASSGGAEPSEPSMPSAPVAPSAPAQNPGFFHRMLHAVGIGHKSEPGQDVGQLPLRIFTAINLNGGNGAKGIALVLKVYHLRTPDQFEQLSFNDFLNSAKAMAALGNSLIDSHKMLLLPDKKYFSTEALPSGTRYIGFVALFRGPAARRWRFVYNVDKSAPKGITLGIHGCAMSSTSGNLLTQLSSAPDSLASVHCPKQEM